MTAVVTCLCRSVDHSNFISLFQYPTLAFGTFDFFNFVSSILDVEKVHLDWSFCDISQILFHHLTPITSKTNDFKQIAYSTKQTVPPAPAQLAKFDTACMALEQTYRVKETDSLATQSAHGLWSRHISSSSTTSTAEFYFSLLDFKLLGPEVSFLQVHSLIFD